MKVLVTGGAGFIGTNLCKKLLQQGHKVVSIDNLITSHGSNIKDFSKNPNFSFIKHDITKPLPSIINHKSSIINHIYHSACPTGIPNLKKLVEIHEQVINIFRPSKVVCIGLNSIGLTDEESKEAAKAIEGETGLPTLDTFRFGGRKLADAVLNYFSNND